MGAYEDKGKVISLKAKQGTQKYSPVVVSGDSEFGPATAQKAVVGFLQNTVITGEAGGVMINGISFAVAFEAIEAGKAVCVSSEVDKVAKVAASEVPVGIALTEAKAKGDIISVLVMPGAPAVE